MKLTFGTSDTRNVLEFLAAMKPKEKDALIEVWKEAHMGTTVEVHPIKPAYTREEEAGLHLLLAKWLKMDPGITIGLEHLKEMVCRAMWGSIRQVGPGGQETYIAARRTTRKWDSDRREYVRSKLTRQEYAELIDFVYGMAAQDGVVLPKLERNMFEAG